MMRLLKPHMYLQLPLNFAVLNISKSVIRNNQNEIYTPFPGSVDGAFSMMKAGFAGVEGNSSYPKYTFPMDPLKIETSYGNFLKRYDEVVERFVERVIDQLPSDDANIKLWAKHISLYVPGFPDEEAIQTKHTLVRVLTSFIMNASIIHSADHYSLANIPINEIPLRIRTKMPRNWKEFELDLTEVNTKQDLFRYFMAHEMYFKPSTLTRLDQVNYDFQTSELRRANFNFLAELWAVDRSLGKKQLIPLTDIACSIQY